MIWRTICLVAGLCSMAVSLGAQTNNWQDVEQLRSGTVISVAKLLRHECEFVKATDVDLTCDSVSARYVRKLVFARAQIREVRLELPEHDRLIAGAVAGAVVGGQF